MTEMKVERENAPATDAETEKQPVTGELLSLLRSAFAAVRHMRACQREYARCHSVENLNAASVAEARADELIERVMNFGKPKAEQMSLL